MELKTTKNLNLLKPTGLKDKKNFFYYTLKEQKTRYGYFYILIELSENYVFQENCRLYTVLEPQVYNR